MKELNRAVFRAYDIRGVVDEDFDVEWVARLGKAIGTYFVHQGELSCVVGYDCRHSSVQYHDALVASILSTGVDVISIGMVPTPVLYFAIRFLRRNAGVMITASHNPAEYNGFKVWCGESTIHTDAIQTLYSLMEEGNFAEGRAYGSVVDVVPSYIEAVAQRIQIERPVKVVLDGGNGAGGEVCNRVLAAIGATCLDIHCRPDGFFPAHHPDPTVEKNMLDVRRAIADYRAELGIGLDGDADRIGVMDEKGRLLYGDELLALYARDFLSRNRNAKVIADVKCSHNLFKDIAQHGGVPIIARTGHSMIKEAMREENALLAGEMSGHMFFAEDWFGFDDAIYAAAKLLEIYARSNVAFSQYVAWEPMHTTPEVHISCDDTIKFAVVEEIKNKLTEDFFDAPCDMVYVDGVRVNFADSWALVRASNTQPVLVLRFEAQSKKQLAKLKSAVESLVKDVIEQLSPRESDIQ